MVDEILIESSKKVFSITLNRPDKLNALNFDMMRQIKKGLIEAEEDETIQLIVFKSARCRAFSTGFDIQQILTLPVDQKNAFFKMNDEISEIVLTSEKLYMSVIRGFAVAAGFAFCLFSDFRIAEHNTDIYFALPEITVGIFPYAVLTLSFYYLPPSIAVDLIFKGTQLSLSRAINIGFVHSVFSSEEFDKSEKKYIRSIISQNPSVQRITKVCYNIERKEVLKRIHMEKEFTQVCLNPESITRTKIAELKEKWSQ